MSTDLGGGQYVDLIAVSVNKVFKSYLFSLLPPILKHPSKSYKLEISIFKFLK